MIHSTDQTDNAMSDEEYRICLVFMKKNASFSTYKFSYEILPK